MVTHETITGRIKMEKKLLRNETYYRTLFDEAGEGILIRSRKGDYLDANQCLLGMLGYTLDEFQQLKDEDLIHSEDLEAYPVEKVCRRLDVGETVIIERRCRCKDGSYLPMQLTVRMVDRVNGLIQGLVRNITDRKKAEEELRESEERHRLIVESSTDAILVRSGEEIIYANPAAVKLFRASHARELIGKRYLDLVHPDDRPESIARIRKGTNEKWIAPPREHRLMNLDGQVVHVESVGVPIQHMGETQIFGVFRDITERKQAQEALRHQIDFLQQLINAIPAPIFIKDIKGAYTGCNKAFEDFKGLRREDIIGKTPYDISPPNLARLYEQKDSQLYEHGGPQVYEGQSAAADGSLRNMVFHKAPLCGADGSITGMVGALLDISDRKRAEEALSVKHRELQASVQQLEQSRNMLQLIIESIPVRVFWKDRDSRFLGCNNLFARDAGLNQPEQLMGRDDFAMSWSEQAELYRADDLQVMESGLPKMNFVEPQTTPTGGNIWLNTSKVPLQMPNGEVFGVLGIYEDITERKRAEEALHQANETLRAMLDAAPVAVFDLDTEGRVKSLWNPAAEQMLGWRRDEVLGQFLPTVPEESKEEFAGFREWVRSGKSIIGKDLVRRRKDGSLIEYSLYTAPEYNADGEVIGNIAVLVDITQRKQIEKELIRAKEEWELTFDSIPDLIAILDTQHRIVRVNRPMAAKLGITPAEAVGRRCCEMIHKVTAPPLFCPHTKLLADGMEHTEEIVEENLGGCFLVTVSPLRDIRGNLAGCVHIARDINERKKALELLRESQERYRLVADFTYDWEDWVSPSGKFLYVSPSCKRISGYPPSFFLDDPQALCNIIHPEDRDKFTSHKKAVNSTDSGPCEMDFRIIRKDGTVRWISHTCWGVCTEGGAFMGRRGSYRDITEQRLTQEAVRKSEARFKTAFENASVGMAIVDANGVYLEINSTMATMIGYEPSELVGKVVADFIHSDDSGMRRQFMQDLLEGRIISGEQERRFIHRDGSVVYTLIWAIVQRDENGEFQYFISLIQDITKRVLAQQDKQKLEGQLQQAQKMESLGTLAGGIAHDFNNILSVIIGSSELLAMKDAVEESSKDSLTNIIAASQRAKELVRQILAFSRHAKQEKILLNLRSIIKETFEFLRASLPATIQLSVNLDPKAGTVIADPIQMQQILMNLCTNAAHAMEKTGGILQLHLSNVTLNLDDVRFDSDLEPGEYVRLTVTDTGHGIDPGVMNRIFDPYFTTKEIGKGTGLGLSVVHGIVKAHGGTIKVYSEVGKGTSFQVLLPRMESHVANETKMVAALPGGTERILLVDDEKALADIEKKMLNWLGYDVEVRTSAVEALEAFRANPEKFDLVITDLSMPQMTGMKLARQIVQIRPGVPIILCTGFSDQIHEQQALSAGIKSFLLKPLVASEIAAAVRKALEI